MAFWGREGGGGVAKMFGVIFLENDGYGEQKPKMKNTKKKLQSSSHKSVLGEILQKLKKVSGEKFARVLFMCVCVMGYTCHEKKVK